ncbi:hypothetical protein [Pararhizobium arenae]|uniref:hypothetical protein n=1 Tax=Pararhizobium arenae TaxID=1856850 RepID=UPI00094B1257|nr:hypothetical protein [Pararhizobium arenae]
MQTILTAQAPNRRSATNSRERHILGGLLHDDKGQSFLLAHAQNHGRRYRYYLSRPNEAASDNSRWRLSAVTIEPVVEQQLHDLLANKTQLSRWLDEHHGSKATADILATAAALSERYRQLDDPIDKYQVLHRVFRRITVKHDQIVFEIAPRNLLAMLSGESLHPEKESSPDIVDLTLAIELKRCGVESRIVLQEAVAPAANKDPMLIAMLARAHMYLEALTDGSNASHADVALRFNAHGPDISRILPMAFLSPKITEAILTGQQPVDLTIAKLTRMLELPMTWSEQHTELLG